ncbi:hypothetical protein K450DRAFT_260826 [Umbelopsis ramanniana AG]|uniref:Mog1p/PsbP-like protein n=1 Tax=Umbelopsis ramanniana AG TaxID=1314678 RepID=A0AAD5E3D0_UMBRA|nr:uncharacterized protein K450DRAFT_260826 [Umbelopsis ramanniana AG]KAI8575645.1 hypothetical protein K450DRAFT_260826 [Umbelopsis ramanniana AG]
MSQPSLTERPLFGGALSAPLRQSYLDASQIRQIPDNQEVFVDANTEQSLIIELLDLVPVAKEKEIAKYHFQQLAEDNEAKEAIVNDISLLEATSNPSLPSDSSQIYVLKGLQKISKFNEQQLHHVNIVMAIIRLAKVHTDVAISVNVPEGQGQIELVESEMLQLVKGFKVNDWSLFG